VTDIYLIEEKLPNFIAWDDSFMVGGREFVIGETYTGKAVWNAAELPHAIVAGGTGSGKTVILRSIIRQAILKKFNVNILDFKGGGDFSGIKHENKYSDFVEDNWGVIISEHETARDLLFALKMEIESRAEDYEKAGVANIDEYNALKPSHGRHIPWLLVIDEAAEILDVNPKDKEEKTLYSDINKTLRTLARKARSAGVHIVMGIIRPDSTVLDGQIKNNLQFRICGYFADSPASRIVLENDKATELPPNIKGRFIVGDEETQAYYLPLPNERQKE
jgi:S-DNA-T family DNA segregation ATPase FtsK/SpoIIIE